MNRLLAISIVLFFAPSGANISNDPVIMRVAVQTDDGDRELVVTRDTTIRTPVLELLRPVPDRRIEDSVALYLSAGPHEHLQVWSRSHSVPLRTFQRCERLIFYDALYDEGTIWVLYSLGCSMYLDRIAENADGMYKLEKSHRVLSLSDSGFMPYLVESAAIMQDDGAIHLGLRLFGSSSTLRGRDHPFEFWLVEDDLIIEIEDLERIEELRTKMSHELEKKDRPRMSDQLNRPELVENVESP